MGCTDSKAAASTAAGSAAGGGGSNAAASAAAASAGGASLPRIDTNPHNAALTRVQDEAARRGSAYSEEAKDVLSPLNVDMPALERQETVVTRKASVSVTSDEDPAEFNVNQ